MFPTARVVPAPGPVRALRVLVWFQVALLLVGALLGLLLAASFSTGLGAGGETRGWAGLGVALGVAFGSVGVIGAMVLGIPAFLLRDSRPGTKVGALGVVCGLEAISGLGLLMMTVYAVTTVGASTVLVPLLGAAFTAVVVVLGLQPASREWAARG